MSWLALPLGRPLPRPSITGTARHTASQKTRKPSYHMPSHAVVRRAVRSSQLPDPSPFPTIASYIIGQLAKLVDRLDFFSSSKGL